MDERAVGDVKPWSQITYKHGCQALDMNGDQCRRSPTLAVQYHGDGELYYRDGPHEKPAWVLVFLCADHGGAG